MLWARARCLEYCVKGACVRSSLQVLFLQSGLRGKDSVEDLRNELDRVVAEGFSMGNLHVWSYAQWGGDFDGITAMDKESTRDWSLGEIRIGNYISDWRLKRQIRATCHGVNLSWKTLQFTLSILTGFYSLWHRPKMLDSREENSIWLTMFDR